MAKEFNFDEMLIGKVKITKKVRLWHPGGIGLIVPYRSGVIYTNQTGGRGCSQPELEGVYVPLAGEQIDLQQHFFDYFSGPKWGRWCTSYVGIDEETADFIDTLLQKSELTQPLRVDRRNLKESHEAWIKVIIDHDQLASDLPLLEGFENYWSILTWENSD